VAQGKGKTSIGAVLVVLLALGAAGGWNYHRNYEAEVAERGPSSFSGYSSESLEALRVAYQIEIDGVAGEYQALKSKRTQVRAVSGVGDGVKQFEKVQRSANRLRDVTTGLAANEARVRDIDKELRYRNDTAGGFAVHFKRLTGFRLPI
jgi:hypothetical protein